LPPVSVLQPLTDGVAIPASPPVNYYVTLPRESCTEIRLLWPLTWMIPQLIQRLSNRYTGAGLVSLQLVLNVLSKNLIKDPAQPQPLVTGTNLACLCDDTSVASYDYTFTFSLVASATPGAASSVDTNPTSSVSFSVPGNPQVAIFYFGASATLLTGDPSAFLNGVPVNQTQVTAALNAAGIPVNGAPVILTLARLTLLQSLGVAVPANAVVGTTTVQVSSTISGQPAGVGFLFTFVIAGSPPITVVVDPFFTLSNPFVVVSPAQYISFIESCGEGCVTWISTNLQFLNV